jgi:hypothetical protein
LRGKIIEVLRASRRLSQIRYIKKRISWVSQLEKIKTEMNKFKFIIIFLLIASCKENKTKCVNFFEVADTTISPMSNRIFAIKTLSDTIGRCAYYHTFNSWQGIQKKDSFKSRFSIEGNIYKEHDKILLKPKNSQVSFIYFDFAMRPIDSFNISFKFDYNDFGGNKVYENKNYILRLVSKEFKPNLNDTIFDFRFQNFGFRFKNDNLNILIGRKVGVIGMYVYTINLAKERCIYSTIGNTFGLDSLRYACGDYN